MILEAVEAKGRPGQWGMGGGRVPPGNGDDLRLPESGCLWPRTLTHRLDPTSSHDPWLRILLI